MKLVLALVIGLCAILGGIALTNQKPNEFINSEPEVIEKTIIEEVPQLENRILDAIKASSTAIEEEAQKAYTDRKTQLEKEIELKITRAYREEIEAREVALEKETNQY